jgi:hypothetical protein
LTKSFARTVLILNSVGHEVVGVGLVKEKHGRKVDVLRLERRTFGDFVQILRLSEVGGFSAIAT